MRNGVIGIGVVVVLEVLGTSCDTVPVGSEQGAQTQGGPQTKYRVPLSVLDRPSSLHAASSLLPRCFVMPPSSSSPRRRHAVSVMGLLTLMITAGVRMAHATDAMQVRVAHAAEAMQVRVVHAAEAMQAREGPGT